MTEQNLNHLTMEGLIDLLLLSTSEFLEAVEKKDETGIRVKKDQVDLLHQVIVAKRTELSLNKAL